MERVVEARPRFSTSRDESRVAAVLTGNLGELHVARAAFSIASVLKTDLCISWVGAVNVGRTLTREFFGAERFEELDLSQLRGLLVAGRIRTTVVPAVLWRRAARTLWPMLSRSSLLVCRRGTILPSSILVCADNDATKRALVSRVRSAVPSGAVRISVLRAIPPSPTWAVGLFALSGFLWMRGQDELPATRADDGEDDSMMTVYEPTVDAIKHACVQLTPELVVLGWHRHVLPLPVSWLHPTAWRLSNQLPSDVLLVPT
jgi:hypothetical protein